MPGNIRHKVTFTKHFSAYFQEIGTFIIINAYKDNPVLRQQIPCQHQAGIHHAAPVRVEAGVRVGVLGKVAVAVLIEHAGLLFVLVLIHLEMVVVDKVVAGVVGRVDVDHLYLAQVAFLQQLQHLQVVALDVQVLGGIPVFAFFRAGAQRLAGGLVGLHHRGLLAHPGKLVCLVALQYVAGKHLPQLVKVNCLFQPAVPVRPFSHTVRKQRRDLLHISLHHVRGFHA